MKHTTQIIRLIIPTCLILSLSSCDPICWLTARDDLYVTNETGKSLILGIAVEHEAGIIIWNQDLLYYATDTQRLYQYNRYDIAPHTSDMYLCTVEEHRDTTSKLIITEPTSVLNQRYTEYRLYCLPDTTSLNLYAPNRVPNIEKVYHLKKNINNCTTEYHLILTEAMIATMEKDTSMLTTFPEYYGSPAGYQ